MFVGQNYKTSEHGNHSSDVYTKLLVRPEFLLPQVDDVYSLGLRALQFNVLFAKKLEVWQLRYRDPPRPKTAEPSNVDDGDGEGTTPPPPGNVRSGVRVRVRICLGVGSFLGWCRCL